MPASVDRVSQGRICSNDTITVLINPNSGQLRKYCRMSMSLSKALLQTTMFWQQETCKGTRHFPQYLQLSFTQLRLVIRP